MAKNNIQGKLMAVGLEGLHGVLLYSGMNNITPVQQ